MHLSFKDMGPLPLLSCPVMWSELPPLPPCPTPCPTPCSTPCSTPLSELPPFIEVDERLLVPGDQVFAEFSAGQHHATIQSIGPEGTLISVEGVETLVAPSEYCWFSITTNNKRIREIDAAVVNDGALDYMSSTMPLGLREGEFVPAKRVRKRLQRYVPVECVCTESEEDCSESEESEESEDEEYCPGESEESDESEYEEQDESEGSD
jgi:hypothetical protein